MAEEKRRDTVIDHPNRRKPAAKMTKLIVILLLLVSVGLMALVTIGGWKALEGGKPLLIAYMVVIGVAFNLGHFFKITPEQADTGRRVLLITGLYVALNFPFSVYGGVISGFQR